MAPLAVLTPYLPVIAAAIGAGAAVYGVNKAEDAADLKAESDNLRRKESMELGEAKEDANAQRMKDQAAQKGIANQEAFNAEMGTMGAAARNEKMAREQEKLMNAKTADPEYAAKFKPGSGDQGTDNSGSFLVPKIADNTGLVRSSESQGGSGLVTPLTFDV